jgi:hypothetical protein
MRSLWERACSGRRSDDEASKVTTRFQTGKLVVDLISDNATIELTS